MLRFAFLSVLCCFSLLVFAQQPDSLGTHKTELGLQGWFTGTPNLVYKLRKGNTNKFYRLSFGFVDLKVPLKDFDLKPTTWGLGFRVGSETRKSLGKGFETFAGLDLGLSYSSSVLGTNSNVNIIPSLSVPIGIAWQMNPNWRLSAEFSPYIGVQINRSSFGNNIEPNTEATLELGGSNRTGGVTIVRCF